MNALLQLDGNILLWIQEYLRNDFFTMFWKFITGFGDGGYFWLAVSIAMLFFKKTRKTGIVSLCSIALCFLVTNLCLKNWIARPRPYTQIEELTILIEPLKSYSFIRTYGKFFCYSIYLLSYAPEKMGYRSYRFSCTHWILPFISWSTLSN